MFLKRPRQLLGCAVLGAGLLLSACGFQLRGTGVDNISLEEIRLTSNQLNNPTFDQLLSALQSEGVRVTDVADYHLQLIEDRHEQVALSYTGRASAAEVELRQHLTFRIMDTQGRVLIGPETLSTQRVYINDRDNIVGTGEEQELLRREMRRDMVRQVLFRLSALSESELSARERALDQMRP